MRTINFGTAIGHYMKCLAMFAAGVVLFGTALVGQTIALNFNSLPSAQGWTYNYVTGCPGPESSIFLVANNVLHQNTMGCGLWGADYEQYNVVPNAPYTITVTARVTSQETVCNSAALNYGMMFGAQGNGKAYTIGLGPGHVDAVFGPGINTAEFSANVDTSQFHTYVLTVTPADGTFTLAVDGTLIGSGVGGDLSNSNMIFLGDGTSCWNAAGDWSGYTFHSGIDTVGPITSNVSVSPNFVAVNANATVTATVDDSTTGGSNIAAAYYTINGGAPSQMVLTPSAAVTTQASANLPPFSLAGVHHVCVHGTDSAGNTGADSCMSLSVFEVPSSSNECKQGGWPALRRADGTSFKNQADCIQYVNTGK